MAKEEKVIITEELGEVEEKGFKIFPEKVWTEEDIKKYLQRRAKLLRHTPNRSEIDKDKEGPRMKRVTDMFGTYEHAIISAGLELPPRPWSQYSDEELLDVAREWSAKHHGGKLSYFLLQNSPDLPSVHLVHKRFGGVNNYFERAGVPHEDGTTPWTGGNFARKCPSSLMYKQVHLKGY